MWLVFKLQYHFHLVIWNTTDRKIDFEIKYKTSSNILYDTGLFLGAVILFTNCKPAFLCTIYTLQHVPSCILHWATIFVIMVSTAYYFDFAQFWLWEEYGSDQWPTNNNIYDNVLFV